MHEICFFDCLESQSKVNTEFKFQHYVGKHRLVVPRDPPPRTGYLGQVLGDAAASVGVGDLRVLQVHRLLPHVLVQQHGAVVGP